MPEIIDTTGDPESSDESDVDVEAADASTTAEGTPAPPTGASSSKKKKKKSKSAKKALSALLGKGDSEVPQQVVEAVLDKVKAEGGVASSEATAENVREALQQMKIMDVVQGKAGIGGVNKKDMGEHKVRSGVRFYSGG